MRPDSYTLTSKQPLRKSQGMNSSTCAPRQLAVLLEEGGSVKRRQPRHTRKAQGLADKAPRHTQASLHRLSTATCQTAPPSSSHSIQFYHHHLRTRTLMFSFLRADWVWVVCCDILGCAPPILTSESPQVTPCGPALTQCDRSCAHPPLLLPADRQKPPSSGQHRAARWSQHRRLLARHPGFIEFSVSTFAEKLSSHGQCSCAGGPPAAHKVSRSRQL